jgi:tRNA modification GTPase
MPVVREAIVRALTASEPLRDTPAITNVRHVALLRDAREALSRGRAAASAEAPEEFIAADLQQARERLDEIVGKRTSDDVLRHIFERFCIGK